MTTALGAPLGVILSDGAAAETELVAGASVSAVLLNRWTISSGLVEVYRATLAPERQDSLAHAAGVEETVTVVRGRACAGPIGAERELREGEILRYTGAVLHMFQACGRSAEVVLLMHYPQHLSEEGSIRHDR